MIQPVRQRLVPGQADEGLLMVMTVGLDQRGQQHHVLHGDGVRGGDFPAGVQHLQVIPPGAKQPGSGFRGVGSHLQQTLVRGQDVAVLDALRPVGTGQGEHEAGPADEGRGISHGGPSDGGEQGEIGVNGREAFLVW